MILHVRPVGLLTGIRVAGQGGMWRAYRSMVLDTDWLQETPLGGTAPAADMRTVLYLFDFLMFHEHVFFVCQKYKSLYYAEIWRLPNSRQDDDQNVQLLEQRHDQQRCKIVKKREFPITG